MKLNRMWTKEHLYTPKSFCDYDSK